jgi:WD40-like Beta Propeller Repeat
VLALSAAVGCGGSSAKVATTDALVAFSRGGEIYVVRADSGRERRLTRTRAKDIAPAGSPDGRKIAFASDRDGRLEVYLMNADGSGQRRLTRTPEMPFPPGRPTGGRSPSSATGTATWSST